MREIVEDGLGCGAAFGPRAFDLSLLQHKHQAGRPSIALAVRFLDGFSGKASLFAQPGNPGGFAEGQPQSLPTENLHVVSSA